MSSVVIDDVESQHHVFLLDRFVSVAPSCLCGYPVCIWVCMWGGVYYVVLRGGPAGIEVDVCCRERRNGWGWGSPREEKASTEYWLSLRLTLSVSVFVSEIWWPHQLSGACLSEGLCVFVLKKKEVSSVQHQHLQMSYLQTFDINLCLVFFTHTQTHVIQIIKKHLRLSDTVTCFYQPL